MMRICRGLAKRTRRRTSLGMKTILWATLTANGNYARATAAHPPKAEALADFAAHVARTGAFVVGRHTFEAFRAQPARAGEQPMTSTEIVVVTSGDLPGVTTARTPRAALEHLARRGREEVLLAGGEKLHNAFLAEDLVDELVLNIAPTFEDEGLRLVLPHGGYRELRQLSTRELGGSVVQLRYAVERRY